MAPGDVCHGPRCGLAGLRPVVLGYPSSPGPVGQPGRPGVSNAWGVGSFLSLVRPMCARCPGPLGSCSPVCSRGLLCPVRGVLGHLAPVHRCARSVWCVARAVSRAPWLPFRGVPAECVVLRVWCPGLESPFAAGVPARPKSAIPLFKIGFIKIFQDRFRHSDVFVFICIKFLHRLGVGVGVGVGVGGTGRPLGKTFFLQCQRRHPELPKIPIYLPS